MSFHFPMLTKKCTSILNYKCSQINNSLQYLVEFKCVNTWFSFIHWSRPVELMWYSLYVNFCTVWPILSGAIALAKILFSGFLSAVFWNSDLKFGIWISLNEIQIKLIFCHVWPTLQKFLPLNFLDFSLLYIHFDIFMILTLNLVY